MSLNKVKIQNIIGKYALSILNKYKEIYPSDLTSKAKINVSIDGESYDIEFNIQDYWIYVEEGRKAGKYPNLSAIREWIKVKKILPKPIKGKLPTSEQLSFLISRGIKEKGIKGKHPLKKAIKDTSFDKAFKELEDEIYNELIKV